MRGLLLVSCNLLIYRYECPDVICLDVTKRIIKHLLIIGTINAVKQSSSELVFDPLRIYR